MVNSNRNCNFRLNYVGRVVGDTAESSRAQIEEQVLSDDADVDLTKLAQFAFKHQVPNVHRVSIWKLLLKVSSSAPEVRRKIADHRQQEAEVLVKSLNLMGFTSTIINDQSFENCDIVVSPSDILQMIRLGGGYYSSNHSKDSVQVESLAQLAIAKQMIDIGSGNYVDVFWLTKKIDENLLKIFSPSVLDEAVESLKCRVRMFENPGETSFDGCEAWDKIPLRYWFRSGGSAILNGEPLYRFWDKLCSGTVDAVIILLTIVFCAFLVEEKSSIIKLLKVRFILRKNYVETNSCFCLSSDFQKNEDLTKSIVFSTEQQTLIVMKAIDGVLRSGRFSARKIE